MKIKILTSCAGLHFSYAEGQIVDTDKNTGEDLIKAGYAEEVKTNAKRDSKTKAEEKSDA